MASGNPGSGPMTPGAGQPRAAAVCERWETASAADGRVTLTFDLPAGARPDASSAEVSMGTDQSGLPCVVVVYADGTPVALRGASAGEARALAAARGIRVAAKPAGGALIRTEARFRR